MKKYQFDLIVDSCRNVSVDTFLLKLTCPEGLPEVNPGQFAEFMVEGSAKTFLRRPISIHDTDMVRNTVSFLIRKVGAGTEQLSKLKPGDSVNVLLPLGNGFDCTSLRSRYPLLAGGGVGVAPLYLLGKYFASHGISPTFLFGGRTVSNLLRLEDFEKLGKVYATTDDGSFGERGVVTDHHVLQNENFDVIYACGPTPMLRAVAGYALRNGVACQVSLEHMMACGIGACLCCVEKTRKGNLCVCKDGPVFSIEELLWQI